MNFIKACSLYHRAIKIAKREGKKRDFVQLLVTLECFSFCVISHFEVIWFQLIVILFALNRFQGLTVGFFFGVGTIFLWVFTRFKNNTAFACRLWTTNKMLIIRFHHSANCVSTQAHDLADVTHLFEFYELSWIMIHIRRQAWILEKQLFNYIFLSTCSNISYFHFSPACFAFFFVFSLDVHCI